MIEAGNVVPFPTTGGRTCLNCGNSVETTVELETVPYGTGDDAVNLDVAVPVRHCTTCDLSFTDDEAEDLRHEAVCRHLGVMTPREVKAVRERLGMSVADLARLTGIGAASVRRWESGALVQNVANDQLLFLLTTLENVELLKKRDRTQPINEAGSVTERQQASRFRSINPDDARMRAQAANFRLCKN